MRPLFVFLIFLPALSSAQKVKVNEYDKFTKQMRIELEPIQIFSSEKANVYLALNAVGTGLHVQFSGFGWGATNIDPGEKAIFLFANDSTITVSSVALQTYQIVLSSLQHTYKHTYFIKESDVRLLSEYDLTGIRKYASNDHSDLKISKEKAEKVKQMSALFLSELKAAKILRTLKDINLSNINKYVGDSVRFCSKVYNTRYFETADNKPTLLDVSNSYPSLVNLVVWEQDRKNFFNAPESLYAKKDVCVSGIVELNNNIPQIVIRNRDQIRITSPISLTEIERFIGDSVTVYGKVFTGTIITTTQNSPTLLNMGAAYPDQLLTLVIDNRDRVNFSVQPETYYVDKQISVTGKVELYRGKPQIAVRGRNQITELPAEGVQASTAAEQGVGIATRTETSTSEKAATPAKRLLAKPASFPGGQEALLSFLKNNIVCPPDQLKIGEKKVVVAKFLIYPDGTPGDIQITNPGGKEFDKEVLRVLLKMPKWEPQVENGIPVPISVTQPVTFARQKQ